MAGVIGPFLGPVALPVREQVYAGRLVFCDVERRPREEIVPQISGSMASQLRHLKFDIAGALRLVEPRLEYTAEANDQEPPFTGSRLHPVVLFSRGRFKTVVDVDRAVQWNRQ